VTRNDPHIAITKILKESAVFTRADWFRRFLTVTTALTILSPTLARAQDASSDSAPPPSRVGEIASLHGTVSYNGAGSNGQWVAATANYPLAAGDSVFTQDNAEAALAVDSSRINLSGNTELQLTGLDQTTLAATQSQGEVFLAINYLQPGQNFAITTPRGTVTISQNGNYDILAGDANDPTVVNVLSGAATVTDPGATLQVAAGQAGVLTGTDQTVAQLGQVQQDAFITEMMAEIAPPPPSYAPPVVQQMTGVSQLGQYGSWDQSPQYGAVWYPQVSAGWAPYRQGHWAYVGSWGYTWVDDEPWGFAPFHYGRWIDEGNRWGWVPAAAYSPGGGYGPTYQPVYAPAVVSFFGAGIAVGITIGALNSGNVGWVPLAPNEPYYPNYPRYRPTPEYYRQINQVNVRNINVVNIHNTTINNYNYGTLANRRAATYIPADAMSRGEMVSRYGKPAPQTMLASARPVGPGDFHPGAAQPGQPPHAGPMALPPPQFQHREAPAPTPSAFAQRHNLPPATVSHQPLPPNFQHPNEPMHVNQPGGMQAPRPPAEQPHPGFATMPGYHAPPPPPGEAGQHPGQPMGGIQQPRPPAEQQHPGQPMGGMQPPKPPVEQQHPGQPMGGMQPPFHPQEQVTHPPMPQVITPTQPYHPQEQVAHPPEQQFHPQQPAHPPAQQFHPQEQQPFHPQEQQQFHPQEPQHIQQPPHIEAPPHVQPPQHMEQKPDQKQ
jgi:hypothetical protein